MPESGPNGAPSKVGRYVVLDVLGMGGMGVVCTAYDPKLDRKVALKLLRRRVGRQGRSATGRARLVREAQALAKLSHPNIVTVHDVDTTPDGRIYMAMEFVRGQTITQWLAATKPGWRAILGVFDHAGRGLAAAHEANITHRDFKPANVLIGEDERVKVLDFGLAKSESGNLSTDSDDARGEPGSGQDIMQVVQSTGDMKLTMAGRIVGTPAYMAPEQRRGRPTGPPTDQFSFAVALYEALYGRLPYRSETHSRDAARGRVIDPPNDTEVPAWVFRALRRALAPQPSDRYPTMTALLDALRSDPARRRRKIAQWSLGTMVLGGITSMVVLAVQEDDALCNGAEARLEGVWDPQRRAVVDASLRNTATAYAAYTADRVLEGVDAYTKTWVTARTAVCEATWVHGEQSEATLDVRMRCLDQRHGELRALIDVLADADAEVVEKAVQAVASLSSPDSCVTAEPGASQRLPEDPESRLSVLAAQARIDDAEALVRAGRYTMAQDVSREALALASGTRHTPTIARALFVQGTTARRAADFDVALARFDEASLEAAKAGDAELEARSMVAQIRVQGVHLHNQERALGIAKAARSAITRAGGPAQLEALLAQELGATALAAGEIEAAIEDMRAALAAAEKVFAPNDVRFAAMYTNLGIALAQQNELVEAESYLRRALALRESALGDLHPRVAGVAQNLANVLASRPNGISEAIELIGRAMTIRRAVFGPDSKRVADLWSTKARLHSRSGDTTLALAEYEHAAAIYRKVRATDELGATLNNIARLHLAARDAQPASAAAAEALQLFQGSSKAQRSGAGRAGLQLCVAKRRLDRLDSARMHCEQAAEAFRAANGETDDELSDALLELAGIHETQGDTAAAVDAARRAIATAATEPRRRTATEALDRLQGARR